MLVWRSYTTDLGRAYPMFALGIIQENQITTNINPLDLLPSSDLTQIINIPTGCIVSGLNPRKIRIFAADGAQFLLNYYQPFTLSLENHLVSITDVIAYEWIGERIQYGRLKRLLENV